MFSMLFIKEVLRQETRGLRFSSKKVMRVFLEIEFSYAMDLEKQNFIQA
jgi:hypothetical protein